MSIDVGEVLRHLDGAAFLLDLFPNSGTPDATGEARFFCPFHDDVSNPSASFNVHTKVFRCFSCPAQGNAVDLLAKATSQPRHVAVEYLARKLGVVSRKAINPHLIEQWHSDLIANVAVQQELLTRRGLGRESIVRWRLGWDPKKNRLMVPIRDEAGYIVNVRQYDLLKLYPADKKFLNVRGHSELRLFPHEAFQQQEVWLTEGELKMIGLAQRGFNSITATGGARGWKDEWDKLFEGKDVVIVYDVDATGQSRSLALARRLHGRAKQVKRLLLPLDPGKHPHGDVLDYLVLEGYRPEDLRNLERGTPVFSPEAVQAPGLLDDEEYETDLASASKAQYYLRRVRAPVIVSAKDTAPYIVPREFRVSCSRDLDCCERCPVFPMPADPVFEAPADDPDLLKLLDVTTRAQERELRELIGVPKECTSVDLVVTDTHNIEEVRLVPQLDTEHAPAQSSLEQAVVRAFFVGHGIETNATYSIKARSAVDPKNQRATLLAYEAQQNVDTLTSFEPSDEELLELEVFRPEAWTLDSLDARLDGLYEDLEANVTRVFQRRTLHVLMDLVWHSALYVTLVDEPMKGWVDALVIGDSGQGKSETANRLHQHYGLGERIDMKGASVAGLKGGLQETGTRWFVTWGVVPLNDRRLVVLEEVKGAPVEVLQALTDMRSSGVAELTKIERRRAYARTRMLWITNPRSDRRIETYSFGVHALKELMGSLEDVRRFDAALIVASNEVDLSQIDLTGRSTVPHRFTSELCRRLILWVWSRRAPQVVFEPAAREACVALAHEQASRYSSSVPLVEPADHRWKLARLAAALAARTFSASEDRRSLVVREAHVRWVVRFLDQIYSNRFMGYDTFSQVQTLDSTLVDPEGLRSALVEVEFPEATVRGLLRSNEIRMSDLVDWSDLDKERAKTLLSVMVRSNALQRRGSGYVKTGAFIEFLKRLDLKTKGNGHDF